MGLTASRTRAGPTADIASTSTAGDANTAAQARRRAKGGSPTPPTPARDGGPPGGSDVSLSAKAEGAAKAVVATTGVWRPFNFAKRKADQQVSKFTHSKYFQQAVRTRARCPLLSHPGRGQALLVALTRRVLSRWTMPSTSATSSATVRLALSESSARRGRAFDAIVGAQARSWPRSCMSPSCCSTTASTPRRWAVVSRSRQHGANAALFRPALLCL